MRNCFSCVLDLHPSLLILFLKTLKNLTKLSPNYALPQSMPGYCSQNAPLYQPRVQKCSFSSTCNINAVVNQTFVQFKLGLVVSMYGLTFEFCSTVATTSIVLETCARKIKARVNSPRSFQLVSKSSNKGSDRDNGIPNGKS